jgi:protein-tyrosine phosphatase
MSQRTQNPPPLKACRFDSDLGHHINIRFIRADRALRAAARYTHRTFTAQHADCASQNTYTLLTHKTAADDPQARKCPGAPTRYFSLVRSPRGALRRATEMTADIYWITDVEPGPGHLAILGRPRPGEWLADEIADWAAAGVTDVISLLEDFEVRDTGLLEEADLARQAGISLERFPIPDRGVPASLDATRKLSAHLAEKIRVGRTVGIHCRASIGRAGMIATGVLVELGVPLADAWIRTSAARGRAVPDTDQQKIWVANAFRT